MYPIQTFSNVSDAELQEKESSRQIIRSDNLLHSHLILHDEGNSIYQSFDINMPYLMIYESMNLAANASIYQEFSENNKVLVGSPYKDFINRSRKLHFHNFYELTFVLSGQLSMKIEDEYIMYRQGDCCLCNKNIHHLELMESDTEILLILMQEEYVQNVFGTNLFYDDKGNAHSISTVFDSFISTNKNNPVYDAKIYADYRCLHPESSESILRLINRMILEISGTHSGKSHMMKALLCRLLETIEDKHLYTGEIHKARLSNEEQIIYKITEAYQKKNGIFSRSEIEKITGYNADYVERILKRHTGKTLSQYGREFLMQKAAELLKNTDLSIEKICGRLGYSNRYYFNRLFIAKYEMTPSEYRKSLKK